MSYRGGGLGTGRYDGAPGSLLPLQRAMQAAYSGPTPECELRIFVDATKDEALFPRAKRQEPS